MYQSKTTQKTLDVTLVHDAETLNGTVRNFAKSLNFTCEPGKIFALPNASGTAGYFCGMGENPSLPDWAQWAASLPADGRYRIANVDRLDETACSDLVLAWGLTHYQYRQFRDKPKLPAPILTLPPGRHSQTAARTAETLNWGRDLINRPSNHLTPSRLAEEAEALAHEHGASFNFIGGKTLERDYPLVAAVGRSGADKPCVIELKWRPGKRGRKKLRSIALVGKGVCFDSGGLDLKPSKAMLMMKKDMGGAAHILTLARLIMAAALPIDLHVVIPAVENLPSRNAMRPMDILRSKHGLSVEIGNTDAEGRLILADALTHVSAQNPELIIDFATLTGAARVATGTELPNLFCNDDSLALRLREIGETHDDPLWPMPLFARYERHLKSDNADLTNAPMYPYAGAITAALFLQRFLTKRMPWVHIDVMGWNLTASPGHPRGGEIQGVRTLFKFLQDLPTTGERLYEYDKCSSTVGA